MNKTKKVSTSAMIITISTMFTVLVIGGCLLMIISANRTAHQKHAPSNLSHATLPHTVSKY